MSKTIRRTAGDLTHWWWYEYDEGYNDQSVFGKHRRDEKVLIKERAILHSDSYRSYGMSKWFRQNQQSKHRRQADQQLIKYKKDPEYVVQIPARPLLPYWD
jgi:hypothetical protein